MNTPTTPPDPDGARLDEWINQNLASLTASLNDAVDVEAGLRDVRLPDRVRSLDGEVDAMLDLDAGLQAILPAATPPRPHKPGRARRSQRSPRARRGPRQPP